MHLPMWTACGLAIATAHPCTFTSAAQSNMELSLRFTFERNDTIARIANGTYDNVRVYLHPHVADTSPIFVTNGMAMASTKDEDEHARAAVAVTGQPGLEWSWSKLKSVINTSNVQESALMGYSAACLYFGLALTEKMKAADQAVPLGYADVLASHSATPRTTHHAPHTTHHALHRTHCTADLGHNRALSARANCVFGRQQAVSRVCICACCACCACRLCRMMGVSWGGTMIEQWTEIDLQPTCANISCMGCVSPPCTSISYKNCPGIPGKQPGNGQLYNGMVAPFVNMSIKGNRAPARCNVNHHSRAPLQNAAAASI